MGKLNEAALAALLEAEDGPVGQLVRRKAEAIVIAARGHARAVLHRLPEDTLEAVVAAIDYEQTGTTAMIGIRDGGRISRYLAEKAVREGEQGWLQRAVTEVSHGA